MIKDEIFLFFKYYRRNKLYTCIPYTCLCFFSAFGKLRRIPRYHPFTTTDG